MKLYLKLAKPWNRAFDEAEDEAAKAAKEAADKEAADAAKAAEEKPVHTQKHVNKLLADERRKQEEKTNKAIQQLETLKKDKSMTDQAKTHLEQQIDELKNSLLTKEEQAKKEREKLDKDYKASLESTAKERDKWKDEFSGEATRNQILRAARKFDAVSDEQLIELIIPKTRLVEVLDADGKGTGKYAPKVKYPTKNDKQEDIELDLTIEDTVKRMKDEPERFGNLFKSTLTGGLGTGGSQGTGSLNSGKPPSDPTQYRIWRAEQRKKGKL